MIEFRKEYLTEYYKKILVVDGREYVELYRKIAVKMFDMIGRSINQQIKSDEKLSKHAVLVNEIICENDEYVKMELIEELNNELKGDK